MKNSRKPEGGVYLVIDPSIQKDLLVTRLEAALQGGISAVQIWNRWSVTSGKSEIITTICSLCKPYYVPAFINEDYLLLQTHPALDGIHFDKIPHDYPAIKRLVGRSFSAGITCGNDFNIIDWAMRNELDYVSFCSMFPSSSAGSCEIVTPSIIQKTKQLTDMTVYISGGITPENIQLLKQTISFDGVAVIGGILKSNDPLLATRAYLKALSEKI
ncbi:thiamine phosphate synthase [Flavitalea sp.]|nr:thiamine phosphate synthase [Flavitalea sp.]